jgi:hypothetical protein
MKTTKHLIMSDDLNDPSNNLYSLAMQSFSQESCSKLTYVDGDSIKGCLIK